MLGLIKRHRGDEGRVAEHGFQEAPQDQEAADGDVQKSSMDNGADWIKSDSCTCI